MVDAMSQVAFAVGLLVLGFVRAVVVLLESIDGKTVSEVAFDTHLEGSQR
jgi:hypothetical protein